MTDDGEGVDYEPAHPDETPGGTLARAMGDAEAIAAASGGTVAGAVVLMLVHHPRNGEAPYQGSDVDVTVTPSLAAYAVSGALWRALEASGDW